MIPRCVPTYSYADILHSLSKGFRENVRQNLRSNLEKQYNVKHVFLLNSARAALYVLLKAYNRPGGVLMPSYTCIVVPESVCYAGYHPVFVDIEPGLISIASDRFRKYISPDIKVVLATHVFGTPCDIDEILRLKQKYDLLVVEDAAPALGARLHGQLVGTFGDAAIISFHPTKVISGEGGGVLLTNDDELAHKIEGLLGSTAASEDYWRSAVKAFARKAVSNSLAYSFAHLGYRALHEEQMFEIVSPHSEIPPDFTTSCSSFSGALFLLQLERLDWNLSRRKKLAQIYQEELSKCSWLTIPAIPKDCSPAWIQYSIFVDDKKAFYKYMQNNGVDLSWSYRYSCADSYRADGFPNAHQAAKTILGLPTYPSLTDKHVHYICDLAKKYPKA